MLNIQWNLMYEIIFNGACSKLTIFLHNFGRYIPEATYIKWQSAHCIVKIYLNFHVIPLKFKSMWPYKVVYQIMKNIFNIVRECAFKHYFIQVFIKYLILFTFNCSRMFLLHFTRHRRVRLNSLNTLHFTNNNKKIFTLFTKMLISSSLRIIIIEIHTIVVHGLQGHFLLLQTISSIFLQRVITNIILFYSIYYCHVQIRLKKQNMFDFSTVE